MQECDCRHGIQFLAPLRNQVAYGLHWFEREQTRSYDAGARAGEIGFRYG